MSDLGRFNQIATGTVAANGTVTLTFPLVPSGIVYNGNISVNSANAQGLDTQQWQVSVNSGEVGTFYGYTQFTLQGQDQDQVVITGSGLIPGQQLTAVWNGRQDEVVNAGILLPSTTSNPITLPQQQLIFSATGKQASSSNPTTIVPANTRSLVVLVAFKGLGAPVTDSFNIQIVGSVSGGTQQQVFPSASVVPASSYYAVFPFYGAIETSATVNVNLTTGLGGSNSYSVYVIATPDEAILGNAYASPLYTDAAGPGDIPAVGNATVANTPVAVVPAPNPGFVNRVGTLGFFNAAVAGVVIITAVGTTSGSPYARMLLSAAGAAGATAPYPFDCRMTEGLSVQGSVNGQVNITTYYRPEPVTQA